MRTISRAVLAFQVAIAVLITCGVSWSQDAVPAEMLSRTLMIRTPTEQGTGFIIDCQGKLYLITARHVVAGMPTENPNIQVRQKGQWENLNVKKILFPKSNDADIAVLKTDDEASKPFGVEVMGQGDKKGGISFGQQVWFLGYPFLEGLSTHLEKLEAPFIKRGTMSAIVGTNPDAVVLYIDGFNNPGFSGGPIIYWDFTDHVYKIVGVVQGYKPEAAKVLINGQPVDTDVLVNSGILIGYSIDHAIQAIQKDLEAHK